MGPIPLEAGQTKVIFGAVCAAPDASAAALRCHELLTQRSDWEHVWQQASASLAAPPALPAAESLALGQQLMNAVLCTNVVYPVYTRVYPSLHSRTLVGLCLHMGFRIHWNGSGSDQPAQCL